MILFDGTHLASDTSVEELHRFAAVLRLKRAWFQDHRIPHYDVLGERRFLTAKYGYAVAHKLGTRFCSVPTRELLRRWRASQQKTEVRDA